MLNDERERLGEIIWRTSRADEGTISATGANIIADAILAEFPGFRVAPEPVGDVQDALDFLDALNAESRIEYSDYSALHDLVARITPEPVHEYGVGYGTEAIQKATNLHDAQVWADDMVGYRVVRRTPAGEWEQLPVVSTSKEQGDDGTN